MLWVHLESGSMGIDKVERDIFDMPLLVLRHLDGVEVTALGFQVHGGMLTRGGGDGDGDSDGVIHPVSMSKTDE